MHVFVPKTVAAKSLTLVLTPTAGGSKSTFYANGVPNANAVPLALPAAGYGMTVSAFSGALMNGKPSGKKLFDNFGVPVDVTNGGALRIAFGGAIASAAFVPVVPLDYNTATNACGSPSRLFPALRGSPPVER